MTDRSKQGKLKILAIDHTADQFDNVLETETLL